MSIVITMAWLTLLGWPMAASNLIVSVSFQQLVLLKGLSHSLAERQAGDLQSEKQAVLIATNQQRTRRHLAELKADPKLMQAAQAYAELMAAKDQMSHTLKGLSLVNKANKVGYPYRELRENIALNTRLDGRFVVVSQWMESRGHRENLLTKDITDIGLGIAGPSTQHRYYYCQLFGAQR